MRRGAVRYTFLLQVVFSGMGEGH